MKTKLLYLALLSTITFYSQTQIGTDIDGEAELDYSGTSVSLSSDGSTIAIGAPLNDENGTNSGHVRVYENMSGVWTQIGTNIDGETAGDESGRSVSLSSDGSIVAIGAHLNDDNGNNSGQVRVYQNISDVWTQIGTDIDGNGELDYSGTSVSLSSDGSILAIGAPGYSGDASGGKGHVRVYKNMSGVWTQIGTDITGEMVDNQSGSSISLSADGGTVAIGASLNYGGALESGHVRVYQNISDIWTQIGADIDGISLWDQSGWSVSLSSDGSTVAIGTPFYDVNGDISNESGHVRVFENMSGVWTQVGTEITGEAAGDHSGWSVSLSSDGNTLAIGSPFNDGNGSSSGHVRVYKNISSVWTRLGTDIEGEAASDRSGYSVSLSSDGNTLAIGAPYNDGNDSDSGHVRIIDLSDAVLLSLENNEISKNFTLYPNPVLNQLQLQLSPKLDYKKATIYNCFGQLVLQSKTTTINVSSLSSGVYFIEVETNKGKGVKRFIKK
ncbi:T9SS type A sorting domain-containing protein [Psychroserpens burtonensis]|uniref:T9SS type A sorting domain-containing protein n=1 Tax=Psychroserpens burtonensis TaxID=49278 RepID=A0A5C7B5R8_9FLAO|nr:T9SS type A sorting domain-containing protein [Psychroserpens burtonensis]TXE15264.1 T9SS type A sorting domain-containing protein [Psychroserpens burtonensis]